MKKSHTGFSTRLLILNGLSILSVVSSHAAHTASLPMFWWTFRYIPGTVVPNYDQFGTLSYYVLVAIMKLSLFGLPCFLFISGFYVSVVSRSQKSGLSWQWVWVTIRRLLIPYLIWSLAIFLIDWLQSCLNTCLVLSLGRYITILLTGQAQDAYWYVVLICQFYILSPLLVSLAKTHPRFLLFMGAFAYICGVVVVYLGLFLEVPKALYLLPFGSFFPRDVIYFVFGIIFGIHLTTIQQWLVRYKWLLLILLVLSAILSLVEAEVIYRILGGGYNYLNHVAGGAATIPMTVYVFSFILCFFAFEDARYPFSRILSHTIGPRSYGIYLIHPIFIQLVPKIFYHVAPWLLAYQILYQPALIIISLGIPVLMMKLVENSRFPGFYRYLFG
jgi:peptidoglycan/LPS O-acetylase OafA/YrhL